MNEQFLHTRIPAGAKPRTLLGKAAALLAGGVILVLAVMFSLVALAVLAIGGTAFAGWLWWKTRAVRRAMRDGAATTGRRDDQVIEGEFVRETADNDRLLR